MGVARDLKLDIDGDLDLSNGRDLQLVEDAAAIAQHASIRLRQTKGEWFLDLDAGFDWFGVVFRKGATDAEIEAEVRRVLVRTPGVVQVYSVVITREQSARRASIVAQAQTDTGALVTATAQVG